MSLESAGSTLRRQCWLDAGSPVADVRRLVYLGSDAVRWIIESTLRRLPPEVAWFSVVGIDWCEVGRDSAAWASFSPMPRALPGDGTHRIAINGMVPDEALPGLLAHEVSHRWRKPVNPAPLSPMPLAAVDMLGAQIYAQSRALTADELWLERAYWISANIAEEVRADEQARDEWGFREWRGHDRAELLRRFSRQFDEAQRMARQAEQFDEADAIAAYTRSRPSPSATTSSEREDTMSTGTEHDKQDEKADDEQIAVYDESAYDECVYGADEPAGAKTEAREPGFFCDDPNSLCDTDGHELAE